MIIHVSIDWKFHITINQKRKDRCVDEDSLKWYPLSRHIMIRLVIGHMTTLAGRGIEYHMVWI